jgi:formylglycine-generating enzyme required for sulfatase activity
MTAEINQADIFISHAHEDKDVARPLAEALRQKGLTVWYDEYVLRLGDSLRQVIERGLASARFGVVILSPSFFAKEWPQRELNGLFARETLTRSKVLLPVWHRITPNEVAAHSPILADRLSVSTAKGLDFVVDQIWAVIDAAKPSALEISRKESSLHGLTRTTDQASPKPGEERIHEVDGSVLVYVPGGNYILGADDIANATPVHRVILTPFWIGTYPVTNEQYARFLRAVPNAERPQYWGDPKFNQLHQPVVGVNWNQAWAYCRWAGLVLPSEAQWEAAARGTDRRRYPWGNEKPTPRHAHYKGKATVAVGSCSLGVGPYGTLDQAGNVSDWCQDVWNRNAYIGRDGMENPVNTIGDGHSLRGQSWGYWPTFIAAAARSWSQTNLRYQHVGFRCLLPA